MPFAATTTGPDKLGLCQALELFANEQWIPGFLDDEQRGAWVWDQWERTLGDNPNKIAKKSLQNFWE